MLVVVFILVHQNFLFVFKRENIDIDFFNILRFCGSNTFSAAKYFYLSISSNDDADIFTASTLASFCYFSSLIFFPSEIISFCIADKRLYLKRIGLSDGRVVSPFI